jgi:hypothetical protein
MPISITRKTVVATYHHARQSDLDPTPPELQAWEQILQSNYETVLPTQMTAHGLDPANAGQVDLALLLAELTEETGIVSRARRGCAVVAGLLRAGNPLPAAMAVARRGGPAAARARAGKGRRTSSRSSRSGRAGRSRSRKPA